MDTVLRLIATLVFFWILFKFLPCSQKETPFSDLLRRISWVKKPVDLSADFSTETEISRRRHLHRKEYD